MDFPSNFLKKNCALSFLSLSFIFIYPRGVGIAYTLLLSLQKDKLT